MTHFRRMLTVLAVATPIFLSAALTAQEPKPAPTLEQIMARVERSYAEGDLIRTMEWLQTAQDFVAAELGEMSPRTDHVPARSNAGELLRYLDYYGAYALGSDPEHDAAYLRMTEMLAIVNDIELGPGRPERFGHMDVATWSSGLVHRVGDFDISHWSGGRIHRIGGFDISYWNDGRPHRIGGIDYSYWGESRRPYRVGRVDLK